MFSSGDIQSQRFYDGTASHPQTIRNALDFFGGFDCEHVMAADLHRHAHSTGSGMATTSTDFVGNIDRTNYWPGPKTDNDGVIRFPTLIPGATYRLATFEKGKPVMLREFTVRPGQTLDLGEVAMSID